LKEVIDTRFLRELFYAKHLETKEKIHRKYSTLVSKNEGILPTIVLAEITQITCALRGKDMAESRSQALIQSGIEIQDLTPYIAQQAGILKCVNQNLPMGDCIIAATAFVNHARVLSDDPHFDYIKEIKRVWI
jgi:Predicted nucleic acid-binding protein, contains PIN domain